MSRFYDRGFAEFRKRNYPLSARFLECYRKNAKDYVCHRAFAEVPAFRDTPIEEKLYAALDPIGVCYEQIGDLERAKQSTLTNIKMITDVSKGHYNFSSAGELYSRIGQYKEALDAFREDLKYESGA